MINIKQVSTLIPQSPSMVKVKVEADPIITKIDFLPNHLSGFDQL